MSAKILDGKKIADGIKEELKKEVLSLKKRGIVPGLAVIMVGSDPASQIYVNSKKKTARELGIDSTVFQLDENASEKELLEIIDKVNGDKKVHGVLVQLPLPKHINEERIINQIYLKNDVDCFHPENLGKVIIGTATVYPCTPMGIIELIKRSDIEIAGKDAVVIGRSNIVGKPTAIMLMEQNATVTICHSKTKDLSFYTKNADILISAVGRPGLITADMVKEGAVVIDVGINRMPDGKLTGDVDFEAVKNVASVISPVPGGVGPMTIAMLMKNTVEAAKKLTPSRMSS